MKKNYQPVLFFLILLTSTIILLSGLALLPHDEYVRYKQLKVGSYEKVRWIYERIHFDPTPIDIAFFGTSHTLNAIDSEIIETQLKQFKQTDDADLKVVNFAIPHFGRDLHQVLINLTSSKKPKLVVIEIRESEARDQHPATHYLANINEMIDSPVIVNLNYLSNLARLPLRGLTLFSKSTYPEWFNSSNAFSDSHYEGPHRNMTLLTSDGEPRDKTIKPEKLEEHKQWAINNNLHHQTDIRLLDYLYFNANRTILENIASVLHTKNIPFVFLYLPHYGAAPIPFHEDFYNNLALTIKPDMTLLSRQDIWLDSGHVNAKGARALSVDIAEKLLPYID